VSIDEANWQFQVRATYGMAAEMIAVIKEHHADFSEAVFAATQQREPEALAVFFEVAHGRLPSLSVLKMGPVEN
jgi:hypothetical protein